MRPRDASAQRDRARATWRRGLDACPVERLSGKLADLHRRFDRCVDACGGIWARAFCTTRASDPAHAGRCGVATGLGPGARPRTSGRNETRRRRGPWPPKSFLHAPATPLFSTLLRGYQRHMSRRDGPPSSGLGRRPIHTRHRFRTGGGRRRVWRAHALVPISSKGTLRAGLPLSGFRKDAGNRSCHWLRAGALRTPGWRRELRRMPACSRVKNGRDAGSRIAWRLP